MLLACRVKNICLRDKSRNYCPRKLSGACHGDDFGLVEKWKLLFWAVQTIIVSSAESQGVIGVCEQDAQLKILAKF